MSAADAADAASSAFSQAEAPCLPNDLLTEVRWLAHLANLQDGQDNDEDAWRLLALLLRSAGFAKALAPLAPRAQLDALSYMQIDRKAAGQLLESKTLTLDFEGHSSSADVAGLVLHGSLQLLGAAPGQEQELQSGSDILYNRPLRSAAGLRGVELLRLPRRAVQEAAAAEEVRAARRHEAAEVLRSFPTLCRGLAELQAIRQYLELLPLFEGISDESILRLCQHFQLLHATVGDCLVSAGTVPDGLRILLKGTAAIAEQEGGYYLPLRCAEAWFCEDQSLECWELCLEPSAGFRRLRPIVTMSDSCDVLFLPRAECGPICEALKRGTALRSAALRALAVKARSEEEAIQPRSALLCPSSPLLQAQEDYWRAALRRRRSEGREKLDRLGAQQPSHSPSLERHAARSPDLQQVAKSSSQPASQSASLAGHVPPRSHSGGSNRALPSSQSHREGRSSSPPGDGTHSAGWVSGTQSVTPGAASFWSGTQMVLVRSTPSPAEDAEEEESECSRRSYDAAQRWAEQLAETCVEGLLAFTPSLSNSSTLRLLPRRGRRELCRQTHLWRAARGEVLQGADKGGVLVVLKGHVGILEKDEDDDLPTDVLQGVADAAARLHRLMDIPWTEQAEAWLDSVRDAEQMQRSNLQLVSDLSGMQRAVGASLLEVMTCRYKDLFPPSHSIEVRRFLNSAFVDQTFLGDRARWVVQDLAKAEGRAPAEGRTSWTSSLALTLDFGQRVKAKYLDISAAGHVREISRPGDLLSFSSHRTLVALEPRTDILVLEPSALLTWLEEMTEDISFAPALADGLQQRAGSQLTANDFGQLSRLLLRHEVFECLEHRCLRDICRSIELVSVEKGDCICKEGDRSTAFVQILAGSAVTVAHTGERLRLPQGSAVGEDVLLGSQEYWPFTLRAESHVKLARLEASSFKEASMDLSGEAAARRRALEAVSERRPQAFSNQDLEILLAVMKIPVLHELDHDQCLEIAKEVILHRIPKGGVLELPKGDSMPVFVVLKGVMGKYEVEATASTPPLSEEMSEEAPPSLEEKRLAQEELRSRRQRLDQDAAELAALGERIRVRPLDVSLQDRLRFHSLKIHVGQLQAQLADEEEEEEEVVPAPAEPTEQPPSSSEESYIAPVQEDSRSAMRHSGVFLTTVNPGDGDADSVSPTDELAEMIHGSLCEYCEGEVFGGWPGTGTGALYRAHEEAALLSVSEAAVQAGLQRCAATRLAERGKFLRECLDCDDEMAEKLLPLFKEETRRKGSVLVKAGILSSSVWLIASGRCSQAAAAPKQGAAEESTKGHRVRPKTKRRFFGATVELGLLEVGQIVGLTSVALQQPEPLTVTAASPEVKLLRADNLPQTKLAPRVLEAFRLALRAKSSWLGQRLENLSDLPAKLSSKAEKMHAELERAKIPLVADSPFLRRRGQALLPGMVALEAVCKHFGTDVHPESEWIYMHEERDFFMHMHLSHQERSSNRLLSKASQTGSVAAAVVGPTTGTAAANARFIHHRPLLWKTFRMKDEVMLSKDIPAAAAKQLQETGPVMEARTPPGTALVTAGEALAPVQHASSAVHKPSTPDRAKKMVTFNNLKEAASTSQVEPAVDEILQPRAPPASSEDALKRRPQIKLRSNSRIFQMSSTEVGVNERRAVREAKSKVPYHISREPLVTPRDSPGGNRSTARQRLALAKAVAMALTLKRGVKEQLDGAGEEPKADVDLPQLTDLATLPLEESGADVEISDTETSPRSIRRLCESDPSMTPMPQSSPSTAD